ncbi:MAG: glycosyltransferase family 2 protein, partial [Myxococcota bacterium]
MDLVLTIGFSLITLLWIIVVLASTYSIMRLRDLPAIHAVDLDADEPPKVTAVIAARDEADHIENTIRGLLSQRHVDLSVVVVNDGSRDGTPTILDRMAETEDRVHVI